MGVRDIKCLLGLLGLGLAASMAGIGFDVGIPDRDWVS